MDDNEYSPASVGGQDSGANLLDTFKTIAGGAGTILTSLNNDPQNTKLQEKRPLEPTAANPNALAKYTPWLIAAGLMLVAFFFLRKR